MNRIVKILVRLFQRKPVPTARERWLRTLMMNLMWAGLGSISLGLTGGVGVITGATPDAIYRQAPVSGTGALVLLAVGPVLLFGATMIADRMLSPA